MIEHYDKVWKLLEKPERWTRGASARDEEGHLAAFDSLKAECWCTIGGIAKVYGGAISTHSSFLKLVEKVGIFVGAWNDDHTHAEVLSVLKELDI